jgi:hypothetical protein
MVAAVNSRGGAADDGSGLEQFSRSLSATIFAWISDNIVSPLRNIFNQLCKKKYAQSPISDTMAILAKFLTTIGTRIPEMSNSTKTRQTILYLPQRVRSR